jgi:hypothetical protein
MKDIKREAVHQQVMDALDAAWEVFAAEAQTASDEYHVIAMARAESASSVPTKKFVPFVIMIRRKEATSTKGLGVEILWARHFPLRKEGRTRLMTSPISKGKNNPYSRRSMGSGPAWFEELFAEFEPRLTALRSLIKTNRQARQTLNKNHKAKI